MSENPDWHNIFKVRGLSTPPSGKILDPSNWTMSQSTAQQKSSGAKPRFSAADIKAMSAQVNHVDESVEVRLENISRLITDYKKAKGDLNQQASIADSLKQAAVLFSKKFNELKIKSDAFANHSIRSYGASFIEITKIDDKGKNLFRLSLSDDANNLFIEIPGFSTRTYSKNPPI